MIKKRSSEILADENQEISQEKVKFLLQIIENNPHLCQRIIR